MVRQRLGRFLGLFFVIFLLLVACDRTAREATDSNAASQRVVILGTLTGVGQDIVEQAIAPFAEATGIEVVYEGTDAFTTVLPVRVEAGNKPDIALFPQPGLMADLAREGEMVPLDFLDAATLSQAYAPDWLQLGSVDDQLYGLWMRADVKSLVWYNPKAFADAGYTLPQTWDELMALSQTMAASGTPPWCIGFESGEATGWVGTDWIEDILLRSAGPAVYDQWVQHEIPFTAAPVKSAFERFGAIAKDPRLVLGGPTSVISTPFGDAPAPMFDNPPGCYLHHQANFITDFLPDSVVLGQDVQVFPLPSINPEFGTPVLVGGIVFGMLNDTPAARALMEYLATAQPHEVWAKQGYISPHQQVNLEVYPDALVRQVAEILAGAETIRFDGSDLMPAVVGTGTFWTGVVDYVGGQNLDPILQTIDESWPQLGE